MKFPRFSVSAAACIGFASGILILPLEWLLSWLIAVSVHEIGHLLALLCLGIPIYEIEIGLFGARISTDLMLPAQELVAAASGPVMSLSLVLFASDMPLTALIGLTQGVFNLLPIYPLDGGRMARGLINLMLARFNGRKIPCKENNLRVQ